MPMFEYRCAGCGVKFEELVSGDEKVTCPQCGSESVSRLMSTFASSGLGSGSGCSAPAGSGFG